MRDVVSGVRAILRQRMASIKEQLTEMRALRGKNQDVVEHMMERVREEKELFERGLSRYTALRNVFTEQTTKLLDYLGLEALRLNAGRTRRSIEGSLFTKGVRGAMGEFFSNIRRDLDQAAHQANEIHDLMRAMYARFSKEHGVDSTTRPRSRCSSTARNSSAWSVVQPAFQHAVEHGQQGQVRADAALSSRPSPPASSTSTTSPTAKSIRGSSR